MDRPFFVAELSANHLGSFDRAMALVEAAAKAGANAIKTQCFTPEQMADPDVTIQEGPWAGRELLDLYRETATPLGWHEPLFKRARELGMEGFASVFHVDDVDRMEAIGCPRYKISSFEILDLPLIRYAASKGKPMIISTGMATRDEIKAAGWEVFRAGCNDLMLLKCTSAYPASIADANLLTMFGERSPIGASSTEPHLDTAFFFYGGGHRLESLIGISDHTLGIAVPVAAVTLGAVMIEKHLCLSRADGGPDAAFSSEPHEFAEMVKACREAAEAIGEVRYGPTESEMSSFPLRRRPGGKRG